MPRLASLLLWPAVGLRLAGCITLGDPVDRMPDAMVTEDLGRLDRLDDSPEHDDVPRAARDAGSDDLAPIADAARPTHDDDGGSSPYDAGLGDPDDPVAPTPENRDVTFFVTSDPHVGRPDIDAMQSSALMIEAMHAAPGKRYPEGLGLGSIAEPQGIVITGDLTDDNRAEQWAMFDAIWDANGEGTVRFAVFEGWGNHDFHSGREDVRAAMLDRHLRRAYPVEVADGTGAHYAWDFHDVHFVNLNLYPGMDGKLADFAPNNNDPRRSLSFLIDDLAARVGDSGRPVVISFHYGFDANGSGAWVDSERAAFYEAIAPYNVVAVFVGHSHAQGFFQIESTASDAVRPTIDVYMADDTLSASEGSKTGFYVVHLSKDEIVVAERKLNDPTKEWGFVRRAPLAP